VKQKTCFLSCICCASYNVEGLMMVVCLLSWHTVLSMYEYSFTFNQEDKLLGWIPSTCKWFLPKLYSLSVAHSQWQKLLAQFLRVVAKSVKNWMIFGFGSTNQQLSITNYSEYSWNEVSLVEALFLLYLIFKSSLWSIYCRTVVFL